MLVNLKGKSGAAFDKAHVTQQLATHEDPLALQTAYAKAATART